MLKTTCKWLTLVILTLSGTTVSGMSDSSVESTRAVPSPDGKKTVTVDRFTPVVDGQVERFSGRMLLRVTSNDGSPARQRYIEASQVRVIQPPIWLDDSRLCAFAYNVSKNSNGIVYFEPESNRALQVEFVMPSRFMAASGQIEQELTSLEITEFTESETLKIRNIPFDGGSAFPLVLQPLPSFQGQPWGVDFHRQVTTAIAAYRDFLGKHSITRLELEQASESFSADNKWLGLLACDGSAPWVLTVPLGAGNPAQTLSSTKALNLSDISLSCMHLQENNDQESTFHDSRYLTDWNTPTTLRILRETYDTESDEPITAPVKQVNIHTGAISDITTTATATAPAATPPQ